MPVTETVNEWTFTGDVQSWINEIIIANPSLPLSHAKIEVRGKGSLKRRDLTLYDRIETQPESAFRHYAPEARIEPYGEQGKLKLIFAEPAKPIGPIPFADAPQGSMQGPRYTSFDKLMKAKKLTDLF